MVVANTFGTFALVAVFVCSGFVVSRRKPHQSLERLRVVVSFEKIAAEYLNFTMISRCYTCLVDLGILDFPSDVWTNGTMQ